MRAAFPLEDRVGAVALDREADALEAACRVRARLELLPFESPPLSVASQHPEEVTCPERRLVAPGRLADLDDYVLAVRRIRFDECELEILLEPVDPLLELRNELPQLDVALGGFEIRRRLPPGPRKLMGRLELLQAPADLRRFAVVVVDRGIGQTLLRLGVGAFDLLDEVLHRSHEEEVSRAVRAGTRAGPASYFPTSQRRRGRRSRGRAAPRAARSRESSACRARASEQRPAA